MHPDDLPNVRGQPHLTQVHRAIGPLTFTEIGPFASPAQCLAD
jgi:hypothetical protein